MYCNKDEFGEGRLERVGEGLGNVQSEITSHKSRERGKRLNLQLGIDAGAREMERGNLGMKSVRWVVDISDMIPCECELQLSKSEQLE